MAENPHLASTSIYRWRFGPRATTRRNVETYLWAWSDPASIPWGGQVQDGGAVLGFSFHDLMARLEVAGPDDAWARLRDVITWFGEVQDAGGYRAYSPVPGSHTPPPLPVASLSPILPAVTEKSVAPIDPFPNHLPQPICGGRYVLLSRAGQGGMGVIYHARQSDLDRPCAIKMLRTDLTRTESEAEAALREEATAAGSLDHPNIVGIYEVGRDQGRLFFSMEWVEGQDLEAFARSHFLDPTSIARLMVTLARAMAYAHSRGVFHHDLKPANVMIDAQGQPQITDFGLARRAHTARRHDPARGAGSPHYLAPEQASARYGEPGPLTDVFGLGGLLYFLLTDRPPFSGLTAELTITSVLDTDPVPPRLLRSGLPEELETICLKCLKKPPGQRYASANDLADDLDRFLDHLPIHARPTSWPERVRKACQRHPAIATLGSLLILLLFLVALGASLAAMRIHQARQVATSSEAQARHLLYNADLMLASAAFAKDQDAQVRALLARHLPATPNPTDLRGWEWHFLHHATRGHSTAVLDTLPQPVAQLVTSPDGRLAIAASIDGFLTVWDLPSQRRLAQYRVHPSGASIFAVAPDRSRLLTIARDPSGARTGVVLQLPHLQLQHQFELSFDGSVAGYRTHPEEVGWLVSQDTAVAIAIPSGQPLRTLPLPRGGRGRDLELSPDGRWLATTSLEGNLHLLDLTSQQPHLTLPAHPFLPVWGTAIHALSFTPDSQYLLTAGSDGTVRVWNLDPPGLQRIIQGHTDLVLGVAVSPDNQRLASAGKDGFLLLDSLSGQTHPQRLKGAPAVQTAIASLGPHQGWLSAGLDGSLLLWPTSPPPDTTRPTPVPPQTALCLPLTDRQHYVRVSALSGLEVLPLSGGPAVATLDDHPDLVVSTALSLPNGQFLVAGWLTSGLLQWTYFPERHSGSLTLPLPRPLTPASLARLTFSPQGNWLALSDPFHGTRTFSFPEMLPLHSRPLRARDLVASPDGRWLAVAEIGGSLHLWQMPSGQPGPPLPPHPQFSDLAFSPDGQRLASVGFDGSARLVSLRTGTILHSLSSTAGNLATVTWSMDGTRLFGGTLDGTLVVWDLATGRETFQHPAHTQPITGLIHCPDHTLISLAPDALRFWPAPMSHSPSPNRTLKSPTTRTPNPGSP